MTISEYMNNLALESTLIANEMACDAMLCDFYSANDEEDASMAYESIDLAFDDDDVSGYGIEPATEAGFFKSLGGKFKNMLETIKSWFEKVANTIKGWITKFVDRIKTKVANAKTKRQEMKLAGIAADARFATEDIEKRGEELKNKLQRLSDQYSTETNASKRQQINSDIVKIKNQLEALTSKTQGINDKAAIGAARIFAQRISEGITKAENAFKIACKDQSTIENILIKIANTKISPKNKNSDLVGDRIDDADDSKVVSALKKVKGAEGMLKDLEKMLDGLDKVSQNVTDGVSAANAAWEDFNQACEGEATKIKVMQSVKFKLPSAELVAKATFMAKECQMYADETNRLAKLFGDAPAEGSDEKDKRPAIAKALSAYSKVASELVQIANAYLKIANKGEVVVLASETAANA